jgi:thiamine biosynthesis lipoprotein
MHSPSLRADNRRDEEQRVVRRARPLLGTLVEMAITAPNCPDVAVQAIDRAFLAIARVQKQMSRHDPDSTLSRINRTALAAPQAIDADTDAVLREALRLAAASSGAFDPTATTSRARLPGTWHDIEWQEDGRIRYRKPLQLDFGGIAKGYAVDLAIQSLKEDGVMNACVNAGGDLRVLGTHTVAIRDPSQPHHYASVIELNDEAIATSGSYFAQDQLEHHLIDPPSGTSHGRPQSVSVIAADAVRADALTKVVLFASDTVARQVLQAERARCIILDPHTRDRQQA